MKTEVELANRLGQQKFRLLYSDTDIEQRIEILAQEINRDFAKAEPLVIIGVLKQSFIFIADLVRKLKMPIHIAFMGASSYSKTQSTGIVNITQGLASDIAGKDVLLVEDIIDSGTTMKALLKFLADHKPTRLKICSLFVKPSKMKDFATTIDYVGFVLDDVFVVSYGLDYDQKFRELAHVIELLDLD